MSKALVSLFFVVLGCAELATPPAPPPPPDTGLCDKMCKHLAELGCEEAKPVYNSDKPGPPDVPNETCTDFCEETQTNGVAVNPRCVAEVTSCDQIETYRAKDVTTCGAPSPASSKAP